MKRRAPEAKIPWERGWVLITREPESESSLGTSRLGCRSSGKMAASAASEKVRESINILLLQYHRLDILREFGKQSDSLSCRSNLLFFININLHKLSLCFFTNGRPRVRAWLSVFVLSFHLF